MPRAWELGARVGRSLCWRRDSSGGSEPASQERGVTIGVGASGVQGPCPTLAARCRGLAHGQLGATALASATTARALRGIQLLLLSCCRIR